MMGKQGCGSGNPEEALNLGMEVKEGTLEEEWISKPSLSSVWRRGE
jgi:hypothetical protein